MNLGMVVLYVCVCIPFQIDDGESDDDSIDWDMSSSSSSESDVEAGGTGGYYDITYFLKKWELHCACSENPPSSGLPHKI